MVPTGTLSTTLSPSRPVQLEPSPWRPRSPLYSGLKRKWTSVLWRSLDSKMMSPPRPPSPPEGPPRGTNFSRRKATQPLPPSPALTRISAVSMNMGYAGKRKTVNGKRYEASVGVGNPFGYGFPFTVLRRHGTDGDVAALP